MAKTLPEIRDRLHAIATELDQLAEATKRRRGSYIRAPNDSRTITRTLCKQVRDYKKRNPTAHQRDIGIRFHIDGGRVNEILNGMRNGKTYEEHHGL